MNKNKYIIIGLVIALIVALEVLVAVGYWYRSNIEENFAKIFGKDITVTKEQLKAEEIKEKEFKVDKINKIEIETYTPEDEAEMVKKTDAKIAGSDIYYNGVKNVFLIINDDKDKKHELFELLNKVENKKELLEKIEEHLKENSGIIRPFKCTDVKSYEYMDNIETVYVVNKIVYGKSEDSPNIKQVDEDIIFIHKKIKNQIVLNTHILDKILKMKENIVAVKE